MGLVRPEWFTLDLSTNPFIVTPMTEFRTALVTGAAKRIGHAIALDLAHQGLDVAVHYATSKDEADETVAAIQAMGRKAVSLRADLTREDQVLPLVAEAKDALGPVDVLVNNASAFEPDEWDSVSRESWDLHMEANLRAPFVLMQEFAKALPKDRRGVVVNMIDQRVWNLPPHYLSYTVAKAGLWTLTQTMAQALAPRIRVNGIGPGPTLPNARQKQDDFDEQWRQVPLRRQTTVEDICAGIRFLMAAPSMTGQMIALDGGEHLGWAQPVNGFVPKE